MAVLNRADAGVMRHDNHTAPATLTARTFTKPANFVLIYNSHATIEASVSFDGTNEFPIPPKASFSADLNQQMTYYTKESTGVAALKVLYGSEI